MGGQTESPLCLIVSACFISWVIDSCVSTVSLHDNFLLVFKMEIERSLLLLTMCGTYFLLLIKHKEGEVQICIFLTCISFLSSFQKPPVKRKKIKLILLVFKSLNHITLSFNNTNYKNFIVFLCGIFHLYLLFTFTKASFCYIWFIAIIFNMSLASFSLPTPSYFLFCWQTFLLIALLWLYHFFPFKLL